MDFVPTHATRNKQYYTVIHVQVLAEFDGYVLYTSEGNLSDDMKGPEYFPVRTKASFDKSYEPIPPSAPFKVGDTIGYKGGTGKHPYQYTVAAIEWVKRHLDDNYAWRVAYKGGEPYGLNLGWAANLVKVD